jgi:ectoine hydroxylase-related dioxygenase (phytanoyl-CoA dioxygenase family)
MDFVENGFAVLPTVLSGPQCESAVRSIQGAADDRVGSRALLSEAWCRTLARSLCLHPALARLLPVNAVATQCTLFEKSPQRNWLVSLHQDLSIPVKERVVSNELSGWSEKEGCVFVQPPVSVLESLVAVRVHLDQDGAASGALRVVPGSHRFGRLVSAQAVALRTERGEVVPEIPRGGALVMRPLLLHASSRATAPVARRVLHFVFGPPQLPAGLVWKEAS